MERNEILIAEFMAIDVTDVILTVPLLIVVGGLGIVIGMYISSQLKEHISSNINRKKLLKNINKKVKTNKIK